MRYRFKRVWRDGKVAVKLDPIDFGSKLAGLVPRPRSSLVRYPGCSGMLRNWRRNPKADSIGDHR